MSNQWIHQLSLWYEKSARVLPWRKKVSPYAIWISEVMLQQTQVATVIPYFEKFLKKFPTLTSLAKSNEAEVLELWSGLGYYSRARNLRKGAQFLLKNYAGKFPTQREELLQVPGIGPYTAGAILSIAFDLHEPIVDGNVQRVFARHFGIRSLFEEPATQKKFWSLSTQAVTECRSPRIFNQALMELGALVCTKSSPRCLQCPIQKSCVAKEKGWVEKLPRRKPRASVKELWWVGLLFETPESRFFSQNKPDSWWANLWDLPRFEFKEKKVLEEKLAEALSKLPQSASIQRLPPQKHTVTHHRIHFYPVQILLSHERPLGLKGKWHPLEKAKRLPVSSLVKKTLCLSNSTTHSS